jgi:hypothetical protein
LSCRLTGHLRSDQLDDDADRRPVGLQGCGIRAIDFAVVLFPLLRLHANESAPPEIWVAVEALEAALRGERWPEVGEDWKSVGVTRAWEDVTRSVRRAPGEKLRRYEVLEAVSAAMNAVSSARRADCDAAKGADERDVRAHCREATTCGEEAWRIARALDVRSLLLEPLNALLPAAATRRN